MATASEIITQDFFPMTYLLSTPGMVIDETSSLYPDVYEQFGLPVSLTPSIDPRYVTGPQKYEYRYTNDSGIDVVLRGTYNNVMSTVDVLKTYPPNLRDCTTIKNSSDMINGRPLFDIF